MTTIQTTAMTFPCPVDGCWVFPFETQADLDAHVTKGDHAYPTTPSTRRRFETVPNGFGGTTTRKVAEVIRPTEKQTAFVRSLLAERTGNEAAEAIRVALNGAREDGSLSRKFVSVAIDALLKIERNQAEAPKVDVPAFDPSKGSMDPATLRAIPAGKYLVDDIYLQVDRPSKGRWDGFIFVKLIVSEGGTFVDRRRVATLNPASSAARVDESHRLAIESLAADPAQFAAAFGKSTGSCSFCGRGLTDERSVEVGYGPVCADHNGLPWG